MTVSKEDQKPVNICELYCELPRKYTSKNFDLIGLPYMAHCTTVHMVTLLQPSDFEKVPIHFFRN